MCVQTHWLYKLITVWVSSPQWTVLGVLALVLAHSVKYVPYLPTWQVRPTSCIQYTYIVTSQYPTWTILNSPVSTVITKSAYIRGALFRGAVCQETGPWCSPVSALQQPSWSFHCIPRDQDCYGGNPAQRGQSRQVWQGTGWEGSTHCHTSYYIRQGWEEQRRHFTTVSWECTTIPPSTIPTTIYKPVAAQTAVQTAYGAPVSCSLSRCWQIKSSITYTL